VAALPLTLILILKGCARRSAQRLAVRSPLPGSGSADVAAVYRQPHVDVPRVACSRSPPAASSAKRYPAAAATGPMA
jgi:hypothetical protein